MTKMAKPDLRLERKLDGRVAGVDEVGRGSWAGPVVAAAVILPLTCRITGINDSKKLTAAQRDILWARLQAVAVYAIGSASTAEIDRLNVLEASLLAMRRAVASLPFYPDAVLVDGNRCPALDCPAQAIPGGDGVSRSVAAASIIAKVTRDRLMARLAKRWPYYGWEHNAGYGTARHAEGLRHHGVSPHHRRNFRPVQIVAEQEGILADA